MTTPEQVRPEPRDLALIALYEADQRGMVQAEIDTGLPVKAARLIRGVGDHLGELDRSIDGVSTRWRVARMPPVDRCILRLGLYELRFEQRTPMAVVVSEAVRLAKVYSTERSGAFVNGILAKLAAVERPDEAPHIGNPASS
ncbi:MAG: transcription antitermination factor NusB [Acidimicrobiia bacterium]|nr:transcription antitermination factor NusB [Acidimicrobiia bacterium]MDH3396956.1 transcription antitermination factor NusB [Acidimicrobiia bacterium]